MDSLSQIALGAAVGVAAMGRRTAVWKAVLWGAAAGTLPDLDVLIDHGDPIRNMVLHRAATHAPFWLTLFSLPMAAAIARLHGEQALWRRWWLAIWLALVTHPLLDAMTVYGTQLALPFQGIAGVQRIAAFSKGFYKLHQIGARVVIADLRMGQEPAYVFSIAVADRHSAAVPLARPEKIGERLEIARGLPWLWRRMLGEPLPPPR